MALAARDLLGAWHLVEWFMTRDGRQGPGPMGQGARGRIIYSAAGEMCAFLQPTAWPKAGEARPGIDDFLSYAGAFSLDGDAVHHDVRFCSYAPWIGARLTRFAALEEPVLQLKTPEQRSRSGVVYQQTLVWHRLPQ
jgi:hypothetical protein